MSSDQMEFVQVAEEDRVAVLQLARPPVNAVSLAMLDELLTVFRRLAGRRDISAVVLSSASERCFCAGADIRELGEIPAEDRAAYDIKRQQSVRELFNLLWTLPQPTVAAINGAALGTGAVLVACCDVRYASERAQIGLTEIDVGRCGGGRHLMRLLPQGTLREMYFSGRRLGAPDAMRLGFVQKVVAHGDELEAAVALARAIASKSPIALRFAKEALNQSEALSLNEGYAVEQEFSQRLAQTKDAREAVQAFVERRQPVWTGR